MSAITGGELLARCLANEGVKFVFGLPSPEIDPLLAPLAEHDIRLVPRATRSRGRAHGGGALQDDRPGRRGPRQSRPRLGQPPARSDHRAPRGRARAGRSPRSTVSASSTRRRRRRSRGRISSTCSSPSSNGAARSSRGSASPRSCVWPSARCGRGGPARCRSSCRRRCSTRRATSERLDSSARGLPPTAAAGVRGAAAAGCRAARQRGAAARGLGLGRRPRGCKRRTARDRRAARLSGDLDDGRARRRCRSTTPTTSSASAAAATR